MTREPLARAVRRTRLFCDMVTLSPEEPLASEQLPKLTNCQWEGSKQQSADKDRRREVIATDQIGGEEAMKSVERIW